MAPSLYCLFPVLFLSRGVLSCRDASLCKQKESVKKQSKITILTVSLDANPFRSLLVRNNKEDVFSSAVVNVFLFHGVLNVKKK